VEECEEIPQKRGGSYLKFENTDRILYPAYIRITQAVETNTKVMEESDDLSSGPNEDGELNLSYYDWQEIPDVIHEQYRSQLYKLSLSHNRLLRISHQIGKLTLLKDLDLSYNNIQFVDASIGNCIRLRKLNLSNNHIETLPNEILNCVMIDTLLLNHNRLTSLPLNFYFPALERLDVGNNDLRSIPVQLCSIVSAIVHFI